MAKKPQDPARAAKREHIYAVERLKVISDEIKSLSTEIGKRGKLPGAAKSKEDRSAQRKHIYQVMHLDVLKNERKEIKARVAGGKAARAVQGGKPAES